MRKNIIYTIVSFLLTINIVYSQDLHFTLQNQLPIWLNPASSGAFEGNFRINVLYRDQARTLINPYTTPAIQLDAPIISIGKKDWIGVGVSVIQDNVGVGNLIRNEYLGSVAYHLSLDKKQKNILSFGLQGGFVNQRIDWEKFSFESELLSPGTSTLPPSGDEMLENSFFDLNAGVTFKSQLSNKIKMNIGFSVLHINQPDFSFITTASSDETQLNSGIRSFINVQIDLSKNWLLKPNVFYQKNKENEALLTQLWLGRNLNEKLTLEIGAGYRFQDAAVFLLAVGEENFKVAGSFDLTTSSLTDVSNGAGAFEISILYKRKKYKKPKIVPVIFCPSL